MTAVVVVEGAVFVASRIERDPHGDRIATDDAEQEIVLMGRRRETHTRRFGEQFALPGLWVVVKELACKRQHLLRVEDLIDPLIVLEPVDRIDLAIHAINVSPLQFLSAALDECLYPLGRLTHLIGREEAGNPHPAMLPIVFDLTGCSYLDHGSPLTWLLQEESTQGEDMIPAKPFVIAEIGVNHNGSIKLAQQMIDEAQRLGADAVKFQTFTATDLASPDTPKVQYQERDKSSSSHLEMLSKLELSNEDHQVLAAYCASRGIEFMSTPYGVDGVLVLEALGVRRFKTASADIVDLPLHAAIAATGLPVLMSTGMASTSEIQAAIDIYPDPPNTITLLHAVSKYPTPEGEANVARMTALATTFDLPVGYSDHTESWAAAAAATALGATVIEKHFTLNRTWEGPDHKASADPEAFGEMMEAIQRVSEVLGNGDDFLQPEESHMSLVSRKSLHWANDVPRGHVVSEGDLMLRRPGTGLRWESREQVIGRSTRRAISSGTLVRTDDVDA